MLARLVLLALVGTICGALLGEMVAGQRLSNAPAEPAAYSRLSANPEAAATPPIEGQDLCLGCPDSYGVAARLRAERHGRMDHAFRALGSVNPEAAIDERDDEYRYGGRFSYSEPPLRTIDVEPLDAMPLEVRTPSAEAP